MKFIIMSFEYFWANNISSDANPLMIGKNHRHKLLWWKSSFHLTGTFEIQDLGDSCLTVRAYFEFMALFVNCFCIAQAT